MNTFNNVFFNDSSHIVCITNYLSSQIDIISNNIFISIHNNFFIDIYHNLYVYRAITNIQKIENIKAEKILNHGFVLSTDNKYYKIKYKNQWQCILVDTDIANIIEIYDYDTGYGVNYYFITDNGDIYYGKNMIISGVNTFHFYKDELFYVDAVCGNLIRINLDGNHRYVYKNINLGYDCVVMVPCIFDYTNNNIYRIKVDDLLPVNIHNIDNNNRIPYFKSLVANKKFLLMNGSFYGLTENGKIYKLYGSNNVIMEKNDLGIYKSIYNMSYKFELCPNNYFTLNVAVGINEQNDLTVIEDGKLIISNVHEQNSNHTLKNARSIHMT